VSEAPAAAGAGRRRRALPWRVGARRPHDASVPAANLRGDAAPSQAGGVMAELLARGIAWLIMAVVVLVAIAALIHDPVVAGALLGD
jgi:hypothetical protein